MVEYAMGIMLRMHWKELEQFQSNVNLHEKKTP